MTTTRRLAAILAADVVGYSRLVGANEQGALTALAQLRAGIIAPNINKHAGRLFKVMGDGFLAEFASAVQAVTCAIAIQTEAEASAAKLPETQRMQLRVGVHVGDVMVEGDDLLGDGVNIASRLEGTAEPGGISISRTVHDQVRDRLEVGFVDKGEIALKNIARPVQVFLVAAAAPSQLAIPATPLPLPDKPSIAVLPFQNMSGDPEQEYFADGMVEDITTALSRFKSLFVIARNSSFTYKGKAVDIKQVGRELGVRYVLEGSVRKSGGRVRITGQLIEAGTGVHLWADRFDGVLENIFDLQDQVTASVVGQLYSEVQLAEVERARAKPTKNLDAYDHYLHGLENIWRWTRPSNEFALQHFRKAIQLDHNFALAHAFAGHIYVLRKQGRWTANADEEHDISVVCSKRAIELGREDALALALAGFNLAYMAEELDQAADCIGRALDMNPNLAMAWGFSGWVQVYLGNHNRALEHLDRAERLSPRDPAVVQLRMAAALAHFFNGELEDAIRLTEALVRAVPTFFAAWRVMAMSHARCGKVEEARVAVQKVLELDPAARVSVLVPLLPLRRAEDRELYRHSLRMAGLPE